MKSRSTGGLTGTRSFLTAVTLAACFAAAEARAAVLLDTFGPGDTASVNQITLLNVDVGSQSLAVPFTTASAVTVDSILAAISGSGDLTLGIMSDVGGSPSNTYVHSTVLTDPAANVSLNSLGWALEAGDYWLTAIGVNPFSGTWSTDSDQVSDYAYSHSPNPLDWIPVAAGDNQNAPAARITTAVPEPTTVMLLGIGLLGLAFSHRRLS